LDAEQPQTDQNATCSGLVVAVFEFVVSTSLAAWSWPAEPRGRFQRANRVSSTARTTVAASLLRMDVDRRDLA
jgi:hypothetical protein